MDQRLRENARRIDEIVAAVHNATDEQEMANACMQLAHHFQGSKCRVLQYHLYYAALDLGIPSERITHALSKIWVSLDSDRQDFWQKEDRKACAVAAKGQAYRITHFDVADGAKPAVHYRVMAKSILTHARPNKSGCLIASHPIVETLDAIQECIDELHHTISAPELRGEAEHLYQHLRFLLGDQVFCKGRGWKLFMHHARHVTTVTNEAEAVTLMEKAWELMPEVERKYWDQQHKDFRSELKHQRAGALSHVRISASAVPRQRALAESVLAPAGNTRAAEVQSHAVDVGRYSDSINPVSNAVKQDKGRNLTVKPFKAVDIARVQALVTKIQKETSAGRAPRKTNILYRQLGRIFRPEQEGGRKLFIYHAWRFADSKDAGAREELLAKAWEVMSPTEQQYWQKRAKGMYNGLTHRWIQALTHLELSASCELLTASTKHQDDEEATGGYAEVVRGEDSSRAIVIDSDSDTSDDGGIDLEM